MSDDEFTDAEILAFLDEQLSEARMARLERVLRQNPTVRERMTRLVANREAGWPSIGEIWRRHRLSCPSRSQLGSYLLKVLQPEYQDYIRFHIETVGCRYCAANLHDLERSMAEPSERDRRRQKYFQSSAGYLSHAKRKD